MDKQNKKKPLWSEKHFKYASGIVFLATVIYYLPVIGGALGWIGLQDAMTNLHNMWGIDFLGLVYFAPVVYVAYIYGVRPAIMTAFLSMLLLLPHALLIDNYPNALFKPTAFFIILSAVGAVVAMLQRSEQEHHLRMKEMKCLYNIGRLAGESTEVDGFLTAVVAMIPQTTQNPLETKVRITFKDKVYRTPDFRKTGGKISEELTIGDEQVGLVEIYSNIENPYLKKKNHLAKTLAERISGAIHQIELEHSLRTYYSELEHEVEARTKDLEQVQEKLIRSERLAAVGELASGVGHELRNPLNVIRNCAYLLNLSFTEKGDEDAIDTLKVLDKQIDVANKIVTDLLDFTRIKPPNQIKVELNNLINESLTYIPLPENVVLDSHLNGHHFKVRTDAEQINRVFTNIMTNAVQSMTGRQGKLEINTGEEDGYVWVRFKDEGCGIPPENLEKIYEPLFTTKPKGIGLGLAITRRLVEQNGGKIEVVSEVEKGTIFTVKLPLELGRNN